MDNRLSSLNELSKLLENLRQEKCTLRDDLTKTRENLITHPGAAKASFHDARLSLENMEEFDKAVSLLSETTHLYNDDLVRTEALFDEMDKQMLALLIQSIKGARIAGNAIFCMSAPMYNETNITDGFVRRVYAVDSLLDAQTLRIYLTPYTVRPDLNLDIIRFSIIDDLHWEVLYNYDDEAHLNVVRDILSVSDVLYCQSAFFVRPLKVAPDDILKVYDLHGVVPEEAKMKGDPEEERVTQADEAVGVEKADVIVAVTQTMIEHIATKYPECEARFILMPIFDPGVVRACSSPVKTQLHIERPVIVYAGGVQVWQMIPKMQDAIEALGSRCEYHIFTPNTSMFWDSWGSRNLVESLQVSSKAPQELPAEYAQCDFGFILREDTLVNNVACPTKLVEYMAMGIVPIVNSNRIGDFADAGMVSIDLEDLIGGNIPDQEEYRKMVLSNKDTIKKLMSLYEKGSGELAEILHARLRHGLDS